jgi:hypothetical protein
VPTDQRSQAEWNKIFSIWIRAESEYFTDTITAKADMVVGAEYAITDIVAELPSGIRSQVRPG